MLITGVDMNMKLTRAPQSIYFLAPSDSTKVRINILDATLFISQVELKSPILVAYANVLGMKHKAHYPVTHTQIKIYAASSGTQQVCFENAFLGPIPERIFLELVKNAGLVGSASTNPFHFHHYDTRNFVLNVNCVQLAPEHLIIDSFSPFGAIRAYETLFLVLVYITMTVLT